MDATVDVTLAREALVRFGLDAVLVEDALDDVDPGELPNEIAELAFESDVAVLLDESCGIGDVLAELSDACRRAGAPLEQVATSEGPAIRPRGEAYAYRVGQDAARRLPELCGAVAMLLPAGISVWLPSDFASDTRTLTIIVLTAEELRALMAAVTPAGFEQVFVPPPPPAGASPLLPPQPVDEPWAEALFAMHARPFTAAEDWHAIWARVADLDPACPWPVEAERPPGDDFYALTTALAGEPLATCLASPSPARWAELLYRWALATYVGCRWDVLACRFNPGMAAQGLLGMGQLTWAYLVFEALGAQAEAAGVGALLDSDWVRLQERARLSARQRAYYDLGVFLRSGQRGLQLGRIGELTDLLARGAFDDPERVASAVRVHTLTWGDQYTHYPLYWVWPASIYALARRAGVVDRLRDDSPFLRHAAYVGEVDMRAELTAGLRALQGRLAAVERRSLPPLLDPLPVIVEVRVTGRQGPDVLGHTVIPEGGGAEHPVRAAAGEAEPQPGELWAIRVDFGAQTTVSEDADPLGRRCRGRAAVPTGAWLERLE